MKRLMMSTTVIAALTAGSVLADTSQLRQSVGLQLQTIAPEVNVEALTGDQVAEIHAVISSTASPARKNARIDSVLREDSMISASAMTRSSLMNIAELRFPELDVSALSGEQVLAVLAIVNSGDTTAETRAKVMAVVNDPSVSMDAEVATLRTQLENRVTTLGLDVDVGTLSDAAVLRTMAGLSNDDSPAQQRATIEGALM